MTNKQLDQLVTKWQDMFVSVKDDKGEFMRWAFSLDALSDKSHEPLSDFIYGLNIEHDTAYAMTVSALEAISSALDNMEENDEVSEEMPHAVLEYVESDTPIYNSEIMEFITKNYADLDELAEEYGTETLYNNGIVQAGQMLYNRMLERVAFELWGTLTMQA